VITLLGRVLLAKAEMGPRGLRRTLKGARSERCQPALMGLPHLVTTGKIKKVVTQEAAIRGI
jgi:hypothetical protein